MSRPRRVLRKLAAMTLAVMGCHFQLMTPSGIPKRSPDQAAGVIKSTSIVGGGATSGSFPCA